MWDVHQGPTALQSLLPQSSITLNIDLSVSVMELSGNRTEGQQGSTPYGQLASSS